MSPSRRRRRPEPDPFRRDPFATDHDDAIGVLHPHDETDLDLHPHQVGVKGLPELDAHAFEVALAAGPSPERPASAAASRPSGATATAEGAPAEPVRPRRWQGPRGGSWLNRLVDAAVDAVVPDEPSGPAPFDEVLLDLRALPRRDRTVAVTWMPRGGRLRRLTFGRGLHHLPAGARAGDHVVVRPGGQHDDPGERRADATLPLREQPVCVLTVLPRGRGREVTGYEVVVQQVAAAAAIPGAPAEGSGRRAPRR